MNTPKTPPRISVLFPLQGNEDKVKEAETRFGVKVFGQYLLYEGTQPWEVKELLKGGVCA